MVQLYASGLALSFATTSAADFAEAVPDFIGLANNIISRLAEMQDGESST